MTQNEIKNVALVYNKLISRENESWDDLDDYLEMLEYMSNDEIYRESEVINTKHKGKNVGCDHDHQKEKCFIPVMVEVCESIMKFYLDKNELHPKNRYILQYYLALTHANFIQVKTSY
jgi:hypothetical protein